MFVNKKVSKKYDVFHCFKAPIDGTMDETMELQDPNRPTKTYDPDAVRPIRKPDPSLRELQRQVIMCPDVSSRNRIKPSLLVGFRSLLDRRVGLDQSRRRL